MADYAGGRSRVASGYMPAATGGAAPGKRTLVEQHQTQVGPAIQRKAAPAIQRKAADVTVEARPPEVDLPAGGGRPLDPGVRAGMEAAFSADFSAVRVHEDDRAAQVGAQAYARGEAIHFAPGAYDPSSRAGRLLLAHELAHVLQQRQGRVPAPLDEDPVLEAEADREAARVEATGVIDRPAVDGPAGGPPASAAAPVYTGAARGAIQRKSAGLAVQLGLSVGNRISAVHISGRSDSPFSDTMGSHTTAWVVHCDRVRALLTGCTFAEALDRLKFLDDELDRLPTAAWTKGADALEERLARARQKLKDDIDEGKKRLEAEQRDASIASKIQEAIGDYLTARNYVPGATVRTGDTGGRAEAHSRARLTELRRFDAVEFIGDRSYEVQSAIFELFDLEAAWDLTEVPGVPDNQTERAGTLLGQHLIEVREAYPHSFNYARITEQGLSKLIEKQNEKRKKKRDVEMDVEMDVKAVAEKAFKLLSSSPSEYQSNLVESWKAAKDSERIALAPYQEYAGQLAHAHATTGTLNEDWLGDWKDSVVAYSVLEAVAPPNTVPPEGAAPNLQTLVTKFELLANAAIEEVKKLAAAPVSKEQLTQVLTDGAKTVADAAKLELAQFPLSSLDSAKVEQLQQAAGAAAQPFRDKATQRASLSGKQNAAVQLVIDNMGRIIEFRAGRPESPFSNMGAHTTAWVVHEDGIRQAVIGEVLAKALENLIKLATELQLNDKAPVVALVENLGPLVAPRLQAAQTELTEVVELAKTKPEEPTLDMLQRLCQCILQVENLLPLATLDVDGKRGGNSERSLHTTKAHNQAKYKVLRERDGKDETNNDAAEAAELDQNLVYQIWQNLDLKGLIYYAQLVPTQLDVDLAAQAVAARWDEKAKAAAYWDVHAPGTGAADMHERIAVVLSQHRYYIDKAYPWLREANSNGGTESKRFKYPKARASVHTDLGITNLDLDDKLKLNMPKLLDRMHALFPFDDYDPKRAAQRAQRQTDDLSTEGRREPSTKGTREPSKRKKTPSNRYNNDTFITE